jgi:quercetin dioxygenase-like cupin family protein
LSDLGTRSGVASSTIHKMERYAMTPTVTTLMKIARGLGKDLHFYTDEGDDKVPFNVIRNKESMLSAFKHQKSLIRAVSSRFDNCILEAVQSIIDKGGASGKDELVHASEEICFCLKGEIEFEINGQNIALEALDSVHIIGNTKHRWRNIADGKTEVIFIFCPPVFFPQNVNQFARWK